MTNPIYTHTDKDGDSVTVNEYDRDRLFLTGTVFLNRSEAAGLAQALAGWAHRTKEDTL